MVKRKKDNVIKKKKKTKTTKNKKQVITQNVVVNLHKTQQRQKRRGVAPRTSVRGASQILDPLSTPIYIQNPASMNDTGHNFFNKLKEFEMRLNERERRLEHQSYILQHHREVEADERKRQEREAAYDKEIEKQRQRDRQRLISSKAYERMKDVQNRAEIGNFSQAAEPEDSDFESDM